MGDDRQAVEEKRNAEVTRESQACSAPGTGAIPGHRRSTIRLILRMRSPTEEGSVPADGSFGQAARCVIRVLQFSKIPREKPQVMSAVNCFKVQRCSVYSAANQMEPSSSKAAYP